MLINNENGIKEFTNNNINEGMLEIINNNINNVNYDN